MQINRRKPFYKKATMTFFRKIKDVKVATMKRSFYFFFGIFQLKTIQIISVQNFCRVPGNKIFLGS